VIPAYQVIPAVLAEVLRKAPLCPEKVEFAWRAAVGPAVARVTSVSLDPDGVLHVGSSEAHWTTEVRRSSKLILARLESMLGAGVVKRIATRPS
jgi:predicted nucleic acid-binding Zn ribbon protein